MAFNKYDSLWKLMSENTFEFDGDSTKDFICVICNNVMIDVRQSRCGCQYCYKCIRDYLAGERRLCPGRKEYCIDSLSIESDVWENIGMNNKISKLKGKCPSQKCDLKIELEKMDEHLRLCTKQTNKCPFNVIGCDSIDIVTQDQICAHLYSEMYNHSKLLNEYIDDLRNEITELRTNNDKKTEEIRIMKDSAFEEMNRQREDLEHWKEQSKRLVYEITILKNQMILQQGDLQNEKRETRKRETKMPTIINKIKEEILVQIKEFIKADISSIAMKIAEQTEGSRKREMEITGKIEQMENELKKSEGNINSIFKQIEVYNGQIESYSVESRKRKTEVEEIYKRFVEQKLEVENDIKEFKKSESGIKSFLNKWKTQKQEIVSKESSKNEIGSTANTDHSEKEMENVMINEKSSIFVYVKFLMDKKTFSIQCTPSTETEQFISLAKLKRVGNYRFSFNGSELLPERSLFSQDICGGETILAINTF